VNWGGGAATSVRGPFFYSCVIFVSEGKAPMQMSLFHSFFFFPTPDICGLFHVYFIGHM
jgi:hypothetical protein